MFLFLCSSNGSIKLVSDNIKYGRNKTPEDLGIKVSDSSRHLLTKSSGLEFGDIFHSAKGPVWKQIELFQNRIATHSEAILLLISMRTVSPVSSQH